MPLKMSTSFTSGDPQKRVHLKKVRETKKILSSSEGTLRTDDLDRDNPSGPRTYPAAGTQVGPPRLPTVGWKVPSSSLPAGTRDNSSGGTPESRTPLGIRHPFGSPFPNPRP